MAPDRSIEIEQEPSRFDDRSHYAYPMTARAMERHRDNLKMTRDALAERLSSLTGSGLTELGRQRSQQKCRARTAKTIVLHAALNPDEATPYATKAGWLLAISPLVPSAFTHRVMHMFAQRRQQEVNDTALASEDFCLD